ncbi:MAG: tetratricopeptide repeat protein [Candidatus Omnitrophota bacterium]
MIADKKKGKILLYVFLIIAAGLIIYQNACGGAFIWDDHSLVENNTYIKSWQNIPRILTENIGIGSGKGSIFYRPLSILSFLADYTLWKLNPAGYHLTNIILHILTGLALFGFLYLLFGSKTIAFWTSILFIVHPVQVESVAYISGRGNLLGGFFMLLSLIVYIKSLRGKSVFWTGAMVITYLFAILAKENTIVLIFLLPCIYYYLKGKWNLRPVIPAGLVLAGYLMMRIFVLAAEKPVVSAMHGLGERIPGFFAAVTNYLRIFILPIQLHMGYGQKIFSFFDPQVITGFMFVTAAFYYAFKKLKSNPLHSFAILWFFITLLPFSNIYPIAFYMSENYLYLPSIGFFLVIANNIVRKDTTMLDKRIRLSGGIVLLIVYAFLAIKQVNCWSDPITFYKHSLQYEPENTELLVNLGTAYQDAGEYAQAMRTLKKVLSISPDSADAYNNLGLIYLALGQDKQAIASFKSAVDKKSGYAGAYYNMGVFYLNQQDFPAAEQMLKKALALSPRNPSVYHKLGMLFMSREEEEKAIEAFKSAIAAKPEYVLAHYDLAKLYESRGETELALKYSENVRNLGY